MGNKKAIDLITNITNTIVTIGVGGLFVGGTMTNVVLLSYLPLLIHQIVGWIVIVGGIVGLINKF